MKVQVINKSGNELPKYETPQSAGMDLRADLQNIKEKFLFNCELVRNPNFTVKSVIIKPGGRALIPTGLQIALPKGYEARVQPRSGLALKNGVTILNSPGCVDADYRGDVGIIVINHGFDNFEINQGDRIAQIIISKVEQITWEIVETLDETERGDGGFGHTNIN